METGISSLQMKITSELHSEILEYGRYIKFFNNNDKNFVLSKIKPDYIVGAAAFPALKGTGIKYTHIVYAYHVTGG